MIPSHFQIGFDHFVYLSAQKWSVIRIEDYGGKRVTQKSAVEFKRSAGLIRQVCHIKSFNCIAVTALVSAES